MYNEKCYDHTCINTFAGLEQFKFSLKICPLWRLYIKSYFKGHMIKQILHSWSCHIKFINLAEGLFNKFHMK